MKRATKTKYANLFDDPEHLFPGVITKLWPGGDPVIWFKSKDGLRGFSVRVSDGPAGLGLLIRSFVGSGQLTTGAHMANDKKVELNDTEFEICQYRQDEWSQAFKKWYAGKGPHPGEPPAQR